MRPSDPRLRSQLAVARPELTAAMAGSVVTGLLVIAQAWVVTSLVLAALHDGNVTQWGALTVLVFAARGAVGWVVDSGFAAAAAAVGTDIRRRVARSLVSSRTPGATGELTALATRGASAAEPYLTRYLPAMVLAGVLPVLTLVAIAIADPLSAVIVIVTLPLIPVFGILIGLATRDRARSEWRALASLAGHFHDVMRGLPTLVAFGRAEAQSRTIRAMTERVRARTLRTLRIAFASSAVLELVATLSVAVVAVTVGLRLAQGDLDLRTGLFVLLLAPEAYWPLRRVGAEFHAASEGVATFEAASELIASDPVADQRLPGPMRLYDVSLIYPGRTLPALRDVNVEIAPRGVTAVVGPSGCGKSSLLAILAGLVEPTAGTVSGPPQSDVAWLPQRPSFLPGTVADNLRIAAPDASEATMWAALREVALDRRVGAMPQGLDTPVDEDGRTLSGGERTRLALARVLLADRKWVLLDEPTAHLDALTEQVVVDVVRSLARSRAVVVVAHRPAFLTMADEVVTLPPAEPASLILPTPPISAAAAPIAEEGAAPRSLGIGLPTLAGSLASASGVALTATAGWLIVEASTRPPVLTMLVAIVAVRTFGIARPMLRYVERLFAHDAALSLLARRRGDVFDAIVPLTPGALGARRGDVLAAVVEDVDSVVDRELRVRLPLRCLAVVTVLAAGFCLWLAPGGLVSVGLLAVAGAAAYLLARTGADRSTRRAAEVRARLTESVVALRQNSEELVMWQAHEAAVRDLDALSRDLGRSRVTEACWLATGRALVLLATGAAVAIAATLLAPTVASGSLSGPDLALAVLLPLALGDLMGGVAEAGAIAASTGAAAARLDELTSRAPVVVDSSAPHPLPDFHSVEVRGASVDHEGSTAPLNADLRLSPGGRVAVVGPTGSGKSTLAALLLRFIDPSSGDVRLGGQPLPELVLADVRRTVGLVDDDPHIFATTLYENVRLARPDAEPDDVLRAVRDAHLGLWLESLPDGMNTWLGDGHAGVSGGERARIAIARSLLADQPVLVLDEPTAHLDRTTAASLALEVLVGADHRSVVWITHTNIGLEHVDSVIKLSSS